VKNVVVVGAFDDPRCSQVRFLQEAAALGDLTVLLWSDAAVQAVTGQAPKFPEAERLYVLSAVRYVSQVRLVTGLTSPDLLPEVPGFQPDIWVAGENPANPAQEAQARARRLAYHVLGRQRLAGFPELAPRLSSAGRKKVVVTGCFDWFHSGHVRFFEEVSAYGDLYVVLGHDANIRLLKGEGHPLVSQEERRYMVGSIKYVTQALISTGQGWLDADPEIRRLKPDIYAVNEDGDRGGKREYCAQHGLHYLVLRRTPAPGLPWRSSTNLRGF
jgi:cytidyltransferase-like protein